MSLVLVINPNTGEIMEELIATADYRSSKGVTVKPKTHAEELRLRKIDADAKRIRELKERLEKLDNDISGMNSSDRLEELLKAREMRKSMAVEIQEKENFSQAVKTIHRLQARAMQLEQITVFVPVEGQTAEVDLTVDDYTDRSLSRLSDRLDKLSTAFQSSEPEHVRKTMQQLVEMETTLEALPAAARKAFLQLTIRQELAQSIINTLSESGWSVCLEEEGNASVATQITAENAIGNKAAVIFACDGQIYLETPGFTESTRSALQQLVLGTLQKSGAKNATGCCLDSQPPEDPHVRAYAAERERQQDKERLL